MNTPRVQGVPLFATRLYIPAHSRRTENNDDQIEPLTHAVASSRVAAGPGRSARMGHTRRCGRQIAFVGLDDAVRITMPTWPGELDPGISHTVHVIKQQWRPGELAAWTHRVGNAATHEIPGIMKLRKHGSIGYVVPAKAVTKLNQGAGYPPSRDDN